MDVPSSWLVRPREALYDLDNIQLTSISPSDTSVDAVFELDYLVIEGHARDTVTHSPPRGLQLQLVNSHDKPIADTLVVANLGYLQFRAKPGVFKLEIRDGRGNEVYQIDSVGNEGWDSTSVDVGGTEITLTSFDGLTLYPRFSRKKGMETASVLEVEEVEEKGTVGKIIDDMTSRYVVGHDLAHPTYDSDIGSNLSSKVAQRKSQQEPSPSTMVKLRSTSLQLHQACYTR